MKGKFERMTMADGSSIAVYHARPEGDRRGGLVVVQEIFGITEHIRAIADDYAEEGYEVLAPALFDREQPNWDARHDGADLARAIQLARELHPFETSLADVQTCVDALKADEDAPGGPVFVVGYCYGGSVAWFAAASSYYGSQVPLTDEVPRVPTIAHFGRLDGGIPIEGVEALIARRPAHTEIHVYDAGHGFNSDRRRDFSRGSAELAKQRTLALFRAHGG